MKQVLTLALALLLIGLPAVTLAQTSTSPAAPSAKDKASDKPASADKPTTPSASPSTSSPSGTGGQASPMAPASLDDCKNKGWEKLGFKTEKECAAKVKK